MAQSAILLFVTLLVGSLPAGAETTESDFDGAWTEGLIDLRSSDLRQTTAVSTGLVGTGLEVNIPPGSFRGLGPLQRLTGGPSEVWYRYHVQLLDFDSRSTGKLPGLAGIQSSSARGCVPSRPGAPGWSARGMFGATGTQGAPSGRVPIGTYLYHLDQQGPCGDALFWEDSSLEPGRWHCVEGYVRLNTPGQPDGMIRGWLDGTERFSRSDLRFRRADESHVGIDHMWLNIYFGGRRPTPNHLRLVIDAVSVSSEGRVGCFDSFTDLVGWVDQDGRPAIATYDPNTGNWTIKRWSGSSFEEHSWASYDTHADWSAHLIGDFNGDSRDDIASYHPSNGTWWVSSERSGGLGIAKWATFAPTTGWGSHLAGDFTGNGISEIASYHPGNGSWWVSSSSTAAQRKTLRAEFRAMWTSWLVEDLEDDGSLTLGNEPPSWSSLDVPEGGGFVARLWETFSPGTGWTSHLVGDFNGDGMDDIANYHAGSGRWWVSLSDRAGFTTTHWETFSPGTGWTSHVVGDFNGDGMDDIASYHAGSGRWWVSLSDGAGFTTTHWETFSPGTGWTSHVVGDFNGDGLDDIASYHPSNGTWWVSLSDGAGFTTTHWETFSPGTGWTSHLVGDFNGDGVDDIANYHAGSGRWWVSISQADSFATRNWTPR